MNYWPHIAIASYLGACVMYLLWLTDGGSRHSTIVRWRKWAVIALWPLALVGALGSAFVEYMLDPSISDDE